MFADTSLHRAASRQILFFEDLAIGLRATLSRRVAETRASDRGPADAGLDVAVTDGVEAIGSLDRECSFGPSVACGAFTGRMIAQILGTELPGPSGIYLSQRLEFLGPVRPGDVVTASVEVAELVTRRRRARLLCECVCDGRPVVEGEAWVAVPSRDRTGA